MGDRLEQHIGEMVVRHVLLEQPTTKRLKVFSVGYVRYFEAKVSYWVTSHGLVERIKTNNVGVPG